MDRVEGMIDALIGPDGLPAELAIIHAHVIGDARLTAVEVSISDA